MKSQSKPEFSKMLTQRDSTRSCNTQFFATPIPLHNLMPEQTSGFQPVGFQKRFSLDTEKKSPSKKKTNFRINNPSVKEKHFFKQNNSIKNFRQGFQIGSRLPTTHHVPPVWSENRVSRILIYFNRQRSAIEQCEKQVKICGDT